MPSGKKREQHEPVYRLGNRAVRLGKEGGWNLDQMFDDGMHHFSGRVWLEDGFLWQTGWKVHVNSRFDTVEERDAYLATLPPWPLKFARWAVDAGGNLIDCRTGKFADLNDPDAHRARSDAMLCESIRNDRLMRELNKLRAHEDDDAGDRLHTREEDLEVLPPPPPKEDPDIRHPPEHEEDPDEAHPVERQSKTRDAHLERLAVETKLFAHLRKAHLLLANCGPLSANGEAVVKAIEDFLG
jgi:hypothetical protein